MRCALNVVQLGIFLACTCRISAGQQQEIFQPADTSSPRETLASFIESCNEFNLVVQKERYFDRTTGIARPHAMRILDCLDTSDIPDYERIDAAGEAAACLKEIIDRFELPPFEEIPGSDAIGSATVGEPLPQWRIPGTRITIARIEEGPQRHEYLFSRGTVSRAVEYYHDVESLPYRTSGPEVSPGLYEWYVSSPGHPVVGRLVDWLPDWFRERTWIIARWKWVGLLIAVPLALLLLGTTYRLYSRLSARYQDRALLRYCLTILLPVLAVLIPLAFRSFVHSYLTLRGSPLYVVSFVANMAALLASLIVVFGVSNRVAANYWDFLEFGEKINFAVLRAFEVQGIQVSLPLRVAQTTIDGREKPMEVNPIKPQSAT